MNRLLYWSIVSALAGFLFGFDTVVISGAEQTIQKLWGLSDFMHGAVMGSALWGMVLGAIFGSLPTDVFGRRATLTWIGILYFASAAWSGLASGPYTLIIARFIGGLGVGVSTVAAPLFISEIAPPNRRGLLAGLFQFNIVFGILMAYVSNMLIAPLGANSWRFMLGVEALPAMIYTLMCFTLPESPRWLLINRDQRAEAIKTLALISPDESPAAIEQLADRIEQSRPQSASSNVQPRPRLSKPIMLAFFIAFFNQWSGINAILYFSIRIFEKAGFTDSASFMNSVGIGITNLIFTFIGLWLIDILGRKTLLLIGSVGYIVSLGLCSWAFSTERFSLIPYCIFAFIGAHAVGQGAVIWVFISEIFPGRYRAIGQSVGSATHWVFAAVIATLFPVVAARYSQSAIFAFFCGMMVLQLIWVLTMVPETKGIALEDMEAKLA